MSTFGVRSDFVTQYGLNFENEIAVDLFAGGGGASTAYEMATGRPVDVAINHDPDAISMHTVNHPHADHYESDVFEVDPVDACHGRPVGHLHASPDCTHFSQALGGQPRKRAIRSLSWVVHKWAGTVRPRIITLENVEQILQWSPLVAKRDKATGRVIRLDGTVAAPGERVPIRDQFLVPDRSRRGHNWRHFIQGLRRLGYAVQWRTIAAADFGAGTTRARLYLVARCDGRPIVWPKPTHARTPSKGLKKHVSAASCIDWSIPSHSIFLSREEARAVGVKRPLADTTLRRIARGVQRFVLGAADPYIVPIKHAVATAFMAQANGGFSWSPARNLRDPVSTVTVTGSQQQLVTAHLAHLRGGCDARSAEEPLRTISAGGEHHGLVECTLSPEHEVSALRVAAFLMHYYSEGGQWGAIDKPLGSITTRDRLALVTVYVQGAPFVIVDICLRMLAPRELYRAQGFPDNYEIERGHDGRLFTKSKQVRFVGNSVSPPPLMAIIRAQHAADLMMAEAAA